MSLQDKASIVLPKGFAGKAGTLECWNPNTDTLVGLSVVRATTATRVNESGLIESVAANVPRRDFLNGGCGDLLVEPQRTNLLLRSEDFTTTWATAASATVTGNTTVAPDGATTADTISLAAVTDSRVTQTFTLANSTTYTLSCFFKNDSLTAGQTFNFRIVNNTSAPNNFQMIATVDLAAGSVVISEAGTAGTGISGTATGGIENYGNGWYRVFVTATTGIGAGTASATVEIISNNARQFFAWGAQLEAGSYATSYIPTVASTVTRNADVISKTSIASLLGDSEGALFVEASVFDADGPGVSFSLSDGTANNRVFIGKNTGSTPIRAIVTVGGIAQFDNTASNWVDNTSVKIALGYAVNNFKLYIDGVQSLTDTSGSTFSDGTLTKLGLDAGVAGAFFYGRIRQLVVFDQALTDTQLAAITTP